MNREEILAMEPGRELDGLVASTVMGWHIVEGHMTGRLFWHDANNHSHGVIYDFNPSTDISAAWEVVEKMRETHKRAFTNELYGIMNPKREAFQIAPIDLIWHMNPLNICKAALLAVMNP